MTRKFCAPTLLMLTAMVAVLLCGLTLVPAASADTLQFGPGSGTDPVMLTSNTSFTVLNNPGNAGSDIAKLLIFFSVPTNLVGQFSAAGANPTLTLIGSFTMSGTGCSNVYDCAGNQFVSQTGIDFTGLNNSDSFVNFTTVGDVKAGITAPTSYTIYLFSDGSIDHKQTVTFSGLTMPQGTYLDGGGVQAGGGSGFTAFTDAGLITTRLAPEPGSLALLSAGLLGLGGMIRRRK